MAPLWKMFDVDGQQEPYLDNPRLFVLNKTKRGRKMATRRTRRAKRRKNAYVPAVINRPRRRRTAKRRRTNAYVPSIVNPRRSRRRRLSASPRRRRGFRRNPPDILGFNIKDIAMAGAAVIASPWIEKQLLALLPVSMKGTPTGRWAVKVGAAVAVGYGAKKVLGGKFGNLAIIALGANLIADAATEFFPVLTPGVGYYPSLGYYPGYATRGLGAGPNPAFPTYTGVYRSLQNPKSQLTDPFRPAW